MGLRVFNFLAVHFHDRGILLTGECTFWKMGFKVRIFEYDTLIVTQQKHKYVKAAMSYTLCVPSVMLLYKVTSPSTGLAYIIQRFSSFSDQCKPGSF